MNDTDIQIITSASQRRSAAALLLGLLQLGALLAYGLLLDPTQMQPLRLIVLAPLFVMTLIIATVPRDRRPTQPWFLAMVPIAAGLVVVTLLVGTFVLPGSVAWWTVGALASAVPFFLIAGAWSRHRAN